LEEIAGKLYNNPALKGRLYELSVKSEAIYQKGYNIYHDSLKYKSLTAEVDLFERGLLFEASVNTKKGNEFWVDKVSQDEELIRVLTDKPCAWDFNNVYYRIGYPKALLMLSNGTIYDLEPRKVRLS
jgi:hypothetical protein